MIIFLNKYDLFVKRISEVPLTVCPAFEKLKDSHAHDPIGAMNAIKNAFKAKKRRYNKEIFIHVTTVHNTIKASFKKSFVKINVMLKLVDKLPFRLAIDIRGYH